MNLDRESLADLLQRRRLADPSIIEVEAPTRKLVVFAIGETLFALPGANVTEILPLTPIYFVPGCPASLEGVINVRGDIASVIRLSDVLGIEPATAARHAAILLGRSTTLGSGLRVDQVLDVLDVLEENIQPPPSALAEHWRNWSSGVFAYQGRSVLLLDLERLFQDYQAGLG